MTKALRELLRGTREVVRPFADFTDVQLAAAAHASQARLRGDLAFPITPELAHLVLNLRAALRHFEAEQDD